MNRLDIYHAGLVKKGHGTRWEFSCVVNSGGGEKVRVMFPMTASIHYRSNAKMTALMRKATTMLGEVVRGKRTIPGYWSIHKI